MINISVLAILLAKKFVQTYFILTFGNLFLTIMEFYFQKYYQALCYFALNLVGDPELSKDIVQEVFVKIIVSKIEFDSEIRFRKYIYQAVRNNCLTHLTSVANETTVPISTLTEDDIHSDKESDTEIVKAELIREINNAIDSLPPRYGHIFRLAYIDRLSSEEIAEQLGISVNTVKVIRQRAKTRLRELLKDLYPLIFILLQSN